MIFSRRHCDGKLSTSRVPCRAHWPAAPDRQQIKLHVLMSRWGRAFWVLCEGEREENRQLALIEYAM